MIYYTSDQHFGSRGVIRRCRRPFDDPETMDEAMIAAWNARVTDRDTVYIVGDLMGSVSDPAAYLRRLRGRKHLILGNNDDQWLWRIDPADWFLSVADSADVLDGGRTVSLCHCPPPAFGGDFLVYGHIHNYPGLPIRRVMAQLGNAFNAGVDVNDFRPVTLEEMMLRGVV